MGRTMKADVVSYTASVCALLIIAGFCGWSWWKAACEDAASNPKSLAERFMHIKSQSMVDIRDGLASRDYRRTEMALGRLRGGADADWYLSETQYGQAGDVFRQTLDQLSRDVRSGDLTTAKDTYIRLTASCATCHRQTTITERLTGGA